MDIIHVALTVFGGWLIFDGAASIYMYRQQSLQEQLIRAVRAGIGATLVLIGIFTGGATVLV